MKHFLNAQNIALIMLTGLFIHFAAGATGRMTERIVSTVGSMVVFYIAALCIAALAHTIWAWTSKHKPWSLLCILNIAVIALIVGLGSISLYNSMQ